MPYAVDVDESGHMTWPPLHTGTGKRLMADSQDHWQKALTVLAKGPIHDKSGLASAILARRMRWKLSTGAMSNLQLAMEAAGLIKRETRGKRTYTIELAIDADSLPVEWQPADAGPVPAVTNGMAVTPATSAVDLVEAEADSDAPANGNGHAHGHVDVVPMPPPDADEWLAAMTANGGVDYSLLATALLERVVEVVANANESADNYDRGVVLSVQLTHANNQADKLRHRINVLERELAVSLGVQKSQRIQIAEAERLNKGVQENLRRVVELFRQANPNAGLGEDQRKALERMLREIPVSPDTRRNV